MIEVLFVCLGNICRSPLAEGIFAHRVKLARLDDRFSWDSAGTGGWHRGEAPDQRSIAVAARFGVDISNQKARQLSLEDFYRFDLILAMDQDNLAHIKAMAPEDAKAQSALYLDYSLGLTKNVPDPYYGQGREFEAVFKLCDQASSALIKRLIAPNT